jgi:hypothetical protein
MFEQDQAVTGSEVLERPPNTRVNCEVRALHVLRPKPVQKCWTNPDVSTLRVDAVQRGSTRRAPCITRGNYFRRMEWLSAQLTQMRAM